MRAPGHPTTCRAFALASPGRRHRADPELLLVGGTFGPAADQVVAGIRDVLAVQAPPAIADNLTVAVSSPGADAEIRGAVEIPRLRARRPA